MATQKVQKTDPQWQEELSPEVFQIARKKGTEPAFTGNYWDHKAHGIYRCACCGQPLFDSRTKFDSGTGWPSFYDVVAQDAVATQTDASHAMVRTEALCSKCDAHLGHLFPDGPPPTNNRYCINSASLTFEPRDQ